MTTRVTIFAGHGWPVRYKQVDPKTGDIIGNEQRIEAGVTAETIVHSGADLVVHEIQPDEEDPKD